MMASNTGKPEGELVTESNFGVALAFRFIAELELFRACSSH